MGSNYNNKVHFNESSSIDVESSGQILMNAGSQMLVQNYSVISMPVLGTTGASTSDLPTGTTLFNSGVVVLTQSGITTGAKIYTVKAPTKGCYLDIFVATTESTDCQIEINLGVAAGIGVLPMGGTVTTSLPWILATSGTATTSARLLSLVGLSTTLWGVIGMLPSSTVWAFAATSS